MSSPLRNPAIRYGIALTNAAVLAAVGYLLLDGTLRWIVFGIALLDLVLVPQVLKRVAA